jgi:hypothetical protein
VKCADGLLSLQCAVIVKNGDALCFGHEVCRAFRSYAFDEGDDGLLGLNIILGR